MRFPVLFKREKSAAAKRERQAEVERAVTQGLRTLSGLLLKVANQLEAQRLARDGYEKQERFLERSPDKKS